MSRPHLLLAAALLLGGCPAPDPDDDDSVADDDDDTTDDDDSAGDDDDAADDDDATPPDPCSDIVTFETGLTPARSLLVDPLAPVGTGDGSEEAPFGSIEEAAAAAVPGDAIALLSGTYPGSSSIADLHGEAGAPIWLGAAEGAAPVIDATGESQALHLVRPRYVVVHDLEAFGAADNGINTDDGGAYDDVDAARYVVFRDLFLHDVGPDGNHDCLKLSGLDDYWVLDSTFERCGGDGSGSAVDHVGCHDGLIARNVFRDLSANAVQNKGGSTDIEIRWNRMDDAGDRSVNMGGSTGLQFFRPPVSETEPNAEARRIHVLGNHIVGAEASLAFVGCVDCVAAHNTIVNPDRWILRILQERLSDDDYEFEAVRDGVFANNLVWFDRSALNTFVNIGPNTDAESFSFGGNLWYAWDGPGASAPDLPGTQTDPIIGEDPAFAGDPVLDGTLTVGSPAVGAGLAGGLLAGDIEGRCYAAEPAIGAWAAPE